MPGGRVTREEKSAWSSAHELEQFQKCDVAITILIDEGKPARERLGDEKLRENWPVYMLSFWMAWNLHFAKRDPAVVVHVVLPKRFIHILRLFGGNASFLLE